MGHVQNFLVTRCTLTQGRLSISLVYKEANVANILNNTEQKFPFISEAPLPKVPVHIKPKPKYQNASSSIPNGFFSSGSQAVAQFGLNYKEWKNFDLLTNKVLEIHNSVFSSDKKNDQSRQRINMTTHGLTRKQVLIHLDKENQ